MSEKTFSEDMFTGDWIQTNLSLVQTDKLPKLDRCNRIAAEFNRAYGRENPIYYAPHTDWARSYSPSEGLVRPGGPPTARIHDATARRWAEYVLAMGEVTQEVLNAANPGRTPPFRYSKDGPVVRLLVKAIPLITGEHPTAGNVSRELYRQLRSRPR
jgi:hypothetical protein